MSEIFRNRQPEVIKPVDAFPGVEDFQFPALKEHFAHSHNLVDAELLEQGADTSVDQYSQGIEDAEVVMDTPAMEITAAPHPQDYADVQSIGHVAVPDSRPLKNPYASDEPKLGNNLDKNL